MIEEFKIYIVNLKKDKNRRENIIREVEKQNLTNYEIIDAVDGNKLNQNEINNSTFKNKKHLNPWNSKMSPSQIGCALSHIKVYEKFIKTEYEVALILEDDAIFLRDFKNDLKQFILKNFKFKKQIVLLSELKEFHGKALDFADKGLKIVSAGRPLCDLCEKPIDTEGHLCERKNGHSKKIQDVL